MSNKDAHQREMILRDLQQKVERLSHDAYFAPDKRPRPENDETARALIEGVKRTQPTSHANQTGLPTSADKKADTSSRNYIRNTAVDTSSNRTQRLETMLAEIKALQTKLSDVRRVKVSQKAHELTQPPVALSAQDETQIDRIHRIEESLADINGALDQHANVNKQSHIGEQKLVANGGRVASSYAASSLSPNLMHETPAQTTAERVTYNNPSVGRAELEKAVASFATSQDASPKDGVFIPKDRPRRQNRGRRKADQHFQELIARLEAIQERPDHAATAVIDSMKPEFDRLADSIASMRVAVNTSDFDASQLDGHFDALLKRLERVSERSSAGFLEVNTQTSALRNDLERLIKTIEAANNGRSTGRDEERAALATLMRNSENMQKGMQISFEQLRDNLGHLQGRLHELPNDQNLERLEADLVHIRNHLQNTPDLSTLPASVAETGGTIRDLASRISHLTETLQSGMGESQNILSSRLDDGLSELRELVARQGEPLGDDPAIASLQERLDDIRIDLSEVRNSDVSDRRFDNLEARLDNVAVRLDQSTDMVRRAGQELPASLMAAMPSGLDEETLNAKLGEHLDNLKAEIQGTNGSAIASLQERLDDIRVALSEAQNSDISDKRFDHLEARLDNVAVRLDQSTDMVRRAGQELPASLMAAMPSGLDEETLNAKLSEHMDSLKTELQEANSIVAAGVIQQSQKLDALTHQQNTDIDSKADIIEAVLAKQASVLEDLIERQASGLEDVASHQSAVLAELANHQSQMAQSIEELVETNANRERLDALSENLNKELQSNHSAIASQLGVLTVLVNDLKDQPASETSGEVVTALEDRLATLLSDGHNATLSKLDDLASKLASQAATGDTNAFDELEKIHSDLRAELQEQQNSFLGLLDDRQSQLFEEFDDRQSAVTTNAYSKADELQAGMLDRFESCVEDLKLHVTKEAGSSHELTKVALEDLSRQLPQLLAHSGGGEVGNQTLYGFQDDLKELRGIAETMSSDTQSQLGGLHTVLERIAEHLEDLDDRAPSYVADAHNVVQEQPADVVRNEETWRNDDVDEIETFYNESNVDNNDVDDGQVKGLSSETTNQLLEQNDDVLDLTSASQRKDNKAEALLKQMRERVQPSSSDSSTLDAGIADMSLRAGSGDPDIHSLQKLASHVNELTGDEDAPTPKTKAEFIAAARKAAQIAAAEHASQEDAVDDVSGKTVNGLRERFKALTKSRDNEDVVEVDGDVSDLPGDIEEDSFSENLRETVLKSDDFEEKEGRSKTGLLLGAIAIALAVGAVVVFGGPLKERLIKLSSSNDVEVIETIDANELPALEVPDFSGELDVNAPALGDDSETVIDSPPPPVSTIPSEDIESTLQQRAPAGLPDVIDDDVSLSVPQGVDPVTTNSLIATDVSEPQTLVKTAPSFDVENTLTTAPDLSVNIPEVEQAALAPDTMTDVPSQSSPLSSAIDLELPKTIKSAKLKDAVKRGDAEAFFEMGRRFSQGDGGVDADMKQAAVWYERAAAKGMAMAQFRLGTLYEDGIGVEKDAKVAKQWYVRASKGGNIQAMHNLAVLHTEGDLGEADFNTAIEWFTQAADYGFTDSQFNLGILNVRGLGVEQNLAKSYQWFTLAAMSGDSDAATKRDEVAKALSTQELKAAEAAVGRWEVRKKNNAANIVTKSTAYWGDIARDEKASLESEGGISSKPLIHEVQSRLVRLGFNPGVVDGLMGERTSIAVQAFQLEMGLPVTGKIDLQLLALLRKESSNDA